MTEVGTRTDQRQGEDDPQRQEHVAELAIDAEESPPLPLRPPRGAGAGSCGPPVGIGSCVALLGCFVRRDEPGGIGRARHDMFPVAPRAPGVEP